MTRSLPSRLFTWANTLRGAGLGGFLFLLASGGERTGYMVACLALMGVPSVYGLDKKRDE